MRANRPALWRGAAAGIGLCLAAALALPDTAAASDSLRLQRGGAMALPEAAKLDPAIRLSWAGEPHPAPLRDFGVFLGEKRSSSMHRSAEDACRWSLLSALLFLQSVARQHGANAVIGIHSLDGEEALPAGAEFACSGSGFSNYVRLRARIVILPED